MKFFSKKLGIWFLTLSFLVMGIGSVFATKVLHRNLAQMTELADRIFVGVCVEAAEESGSIAGVTMQYTRYTFQVSEAIKGNYGQTVTIKQLGRMQGPGSIVGMPGYEEGVNYLLFQLPESQVGLSSPVGLFQGTFKVFKTSDNGRSRVVNSIDNRGIFRDMTTSDLKNASKFTEKELQLLSIKKGPIDYSRFVDFVKKMVE